MLLLLVMADVDAVAAVVAVWLWRCVSTLRRSEYCSFAFTELVSILCCCCCCCWFVVVAAAVESMSAPLMTGSVELVNSVLLSPPPATAPVIVWLDEDEDDDMDGVVKTTGAAAAKSRLDSTRLSSSGWCRRVRADTSLIASFVSDTSVAPLPAHFSYQAKIDWMNLNSSDFYF